MTVFIGILSGTGMIEAMATTLSSAVPSGWGGALPIILAFISMPLSLIFDPDSFYFGVLPVLSATAETFGVDPVTMGRAAIIGQMTVGFPYKSVNRCNVFTHRFSRGRSWGPSKESHSFGIRNLISYGNCCFSNGPIKLVTS